MLGLHYRRDRRAYLIKNDKHMSLIDNTLRIRLQTNSVFAGWGEAEQRGARCGMAEVTNRAVSGHRRTDPANNTQPTTPSHPDSTLD